VTRPAAAGDVGVPIETFCEAETEALAERLGRGLQGGAVVLLEGELGAGKTVFVRGLARGLDVGADEVASPTFVLLTSHRGRLRLHHADLYRLRGDGDDQELGLEELPGADGVLAIEWAERLSVVPWARRVRVRLEHAGDDRRRVMVAEENE
jgi:tRNA threonylcarbamoyladenosine biosynthesis protein TsaE